MSSLEAIAPFHADLTAIRRDLHAHPELGLDVPRTAALVAERLKAWGVDEVATGVGGHGVVGTIHGEAGGNGPVIGLRADMDALPILETVDVPWRSRTPGVMHACGHDGHTTMLLGAARYLAATRRFRGTARVIFQPGEEGAGGALAMLADGLFERFPCDAVYGLHNRPNLETGRFSIRPGSAMAGGAFFDVEVKGVGAHGAKPETGVDPVFVTAQIVSALQGIVSRGLSAQEPAVLSITRLQGGDAYNVIPGSATFGGTARWLHPQTLPKVEAMFRRTVEHVAAGLGASAVVDWRVLFSALVNVPGHASAMADAAADLVGEARVERDAAPNMGSEDFSFMLEKVPGAYINLGIGETAGLHNSGYAFNDAAIPYGSALLAKVVERGSVGVA